MTGLTYPLLFLPSMQEMPKVQTSMQFMLISEKHFVLCVLFIAKRLFHLAQILKGQMTEKALCLKLIKDEERILMIRKFCCFDLLNFSLFFWTPKIKYYWLNYSCPMPLHPFCTENIFILFFNVNLKKKAHYAPSKP